MLSDLLQHLPEEDRKRVEQLDDQIYEFQGKLHTQEDALRLAELYRERERIIKGEAKV